MNPPAEIGLVTATFRNAAALAGCLDSVAAQRGLALEQVVVDGGSQDGTVELLRSRGAPLAGWVSEPDRGIGDAMNKGIALSTAEWLLFLHADDRLDHPEVLAQVAPLLRATRADIVAFPLRYGERGVLHPRGANRWLRLKTGLLHQATFIRRSVFERIGVYDTGLRVAMDYEFFLRAWLRGVAFEVHDAPVVSRMGDAGVSAQLDWPALSRRLAEERAIHARHASGALQRIGYGLYWGLYPPYKRLAARWAR